MNLLGAIYGIHQSHMAISAKGIKASVGKAHNEYCLPFAGNTIKIPEIG